MTTLIPESVAMIESFQQEQFFDGMTARWRDIRRRGCALALGTRSDFGDYHWLEVVPLDNEGNPPPDHFTMERRYSDEFMTGGDEQAALYREYAKRWLQERGVKVHW